jgi:hypothetical protein
MDDNDDDKEWHADSGHPDFHHNGDRPLFRHDGRSRFVFSTETDAGLGPQFELIGEYVFLYPDSDPLFTIRGDDVYAYHDLMAVDGERPWYTLRVVRAAQHDRDRQS